MAKNDCTFKLLGSCQIFVISTALLERSDTISHAAIDGFLMASFFLKVVHTILGMELKWDKFSALLSHPSTKYNAPDSPVQCQDVCDRPTKQYVFTLRELSFPQRRSRRFTHAHKCKKTGFCVTFVLAVN